MKLYDVKDIESYDIENHTNTDFTRHDNNKPKSPDNNSEFYLVMGDNNDCLQTNKRQEMVSHCETYLMPSIRSFTPLAGNNNGKSEIQDIEDCAQSELNTKDNDTLTDTKSHRTINQPAPADIDSDYLMVLCDNNENKDYSEMQDIEDCAHPGLNTKDQDTLTDIKSHITINQPAPADIDNDYLVVLNGNNDCLQINVAQEVVCHKHFQFIDFGRCNYFFLC